MQVVFQPPGVQASGLRRMVASKGRTTVNRYRLRQICGAWGLFERVVDIHTHSRQVGNSAAMIERKGRKLTATLAAVAIRVSAHPGSR